jgi:hypothetical protein
MREGDSTKSTHSDLWFFGGTFYLVGIQTNIGAQTTIWGFTGFGGTVVVRLFELVD